MNLPTRAAVGMEHALDRRVPCFLGLPLMRRPQPQLGATGPEARAGVPASRCPDAHHAGPTSRQTAGDVDPRAGCDRILTGTSRKWPRSTVIKSMRSWNDLEAGIVVEDAEVAVVVDGDADARVLVLADPGVLRAPVRPGSFESRGGSTRGTDGTTSTRRGRQCTTSARTGSARPRGRRARASARARRAPAIGSRVPLQATRLVARLGP